MKEMFKPDVTNKCLMRFDLKNKSFGWLMIFFQNQKGQPNKKNLTFFLSFGDCQMRVAQRIGTPLIFFFVFPWVHFGITLMNRVTRFFFPLRFMEGHELQQCRMSNKNGFYTSETRVSLWMCCTFFPPLFYIHSNK